jgi:hypothetical protein
LPPALALRGSSGLQTLPTQEGAETPNRNGVGWMMPGLTLTRLPLPSIHRTRLPFGEKMGVEKSYCGA